MLKKTFILGLLPAILVILSCGLAQAAIQSMSANYLTTSFTAIGGVYSLGVLSISDFADIVVENTLGQQTTYIGGSFAMSSSLKTDTSLNGIASGYFDGGSLSFIDSGDNVYCSPLRNRPKYGSIS